MYYVMAEVWRGDTHGILPLKQVLRLPSRHLGIVDIAQRFSARGGSAHRGYLAMSGFVPGGTKGWRGLLLASRGWRPAPQLCPRARTAVVPASWDWPNPVAKVMFCFCPDFMNRKWTTRCWDGPTQLWHYSPAHNKANNRSGKLLKVDLFHISCECCVLSGMEFG